MTQLNSLPVEISQGTDVKGYSGNKAVKFNTAETKFSDVIDQHYHDNKIALSDKRVKDNGNHQPKAASNSQESLTSKAAKDSIGNHTQEKPSKDKHILPIPKPAITDSDVIEVDARSSEHKHILPMPPFQESEIIKVDAKKGGHEYILPIAPVSETDIIKVDAKAPDHEHILPMPPFQEDDVIKEDAKKRGHEHILPMPPFQEGDVIKEYANKGGHEHILPMPPFQEGDVIKEDANKDGHEHILPMPPFQEGDVTKEDANKDGHEHILPMPPFQEGNVIKEDVNKGGNEHILPIPPSVISNDVKAETIGLQLPSSQISGTKTVDSQSSNNLPQHLSSEHKLSVLTQSVRGDGSEHKVDELSRDQSVDLLKMLTGSNKLLVKTEAENFDVTATKITKNEAISVDSVIERDRKNVKQNSASLEKQQLNQSAALSNISKDNIFDGSMIEDSISEDSISKNSVIDKIQDSKAIMAGNEKVLLETANEKSSIILSRSESENMIDEVSQTQRQLVGDIEKLSQSEKAYQEFNVTSASQLSVKNELANDIKRTNTHNQNTAAVVTSSEAKNLEQYQINESQDEFQNVDNAAEKISEEINTASSTHEKLMVVPEKVASAVNQTLAAQAQANSLSINSENSAEDLAMQQEQNFESTMNKLNSTVVNSQKHINALNLETISIYRKDFAESIKEKVMVMINQKIQQVEIQLDPPEMGNVHVRVNLQNEQAAVQFIVQNQQAKDALEQNMGKLRDMLAENGVDVGDANIEQRDSNHQSQDEYKDGDSGDTNIKLANEHSESDSKVTHFSAVPSTGVDYYA